MELKNQRKKKKKEGKIKVESTSFLSLPWSYFFLLEAVHKHKDDAQLIVFNYVASSQKN